LGFPSLLNIHAAVAAIKKPGEMSEAAERDIRRRRDRLPLNQPTHEGAAFHTTDKMQRPIVLVTRIRMHPVHPEFRSWVRGRVGIPKFVSHEGLVAICRGAAKEISVGGAHIAFLAMCAMNLPSISAHMQRTHVCGTQRNREANFGFQVYGRTRGGCGIIGGPACISFGQMTSGLHGVPGRPTILQESTRRHNERPTKPPRRPSGN
jgi:hypothetical protein